MLKAKALVATSSDPRYQETIVNWLAAKKLSRDHVRVAVAGCVKDREAIMKNIRYANKFFGINQVYLINTGDDPAYVDRKFSDSQMEREAHRNDLKNTRAAILAEMPKMSINLIFIDQEKNIEELPLK